MMPLAKPIISWWLCPVGKRAGGSSTQGMVTDFQQAIDAVY